MIVAHRRQAVAVAALRVRQCGIAYSRARSEARMFRELDVGDDDPLSLNGLLFTALRGRWTLYSFDIDHISRQ